MYIDSAKSYSQLSTGALALVAVFGSTKLQKLGGGLLIGCIFFLFAVLAGGAHQSLAVRCSAVRWMVFPENIYTVL
jgi:hypothetical protein